MGIEGTNYTTYSVKKGVYKPRYETGQGTTEARCTTPNVTVWAKRVLSAKSQCFM
jgi:hypothetical protein